MRFTTILAHAHERLLGLSRRDMHFICGIGLAVTFLVIPTFENLGLFSLATQFGITPLAAFALLFVLIPLTVCAVSILTLLLPFHHGSAGEFSKYVVVGTFNTALNAAIFNSLILFSGISQGPWVTFFALITFTIVITQAFFWNIFWTFHHAPPQNRMRQYKLFFIVTSATALVNLGIIHIVVNVIGAPAGIAPKIWANIALLFTMVTAVLGNFFGYKFVVFKK